MMIYPRSVAAVALFGFWAIELFLRKGATARSWKATLPDRGSTAALIAAYVVVGTSLALPIAVIRLPVPAQWAGAGLALVGFALRAIVFSTLGSSYSRTLRVTENQELVTFGLYRHIRHPGYLSSLLIWGGAAVASGKGVAVLIVTTALVAAYGYRIRVEEGMLLKCFGERYQQYQARTWRLLPYIY